MLKIGMDDICPYCGNVAVYRSQPETRLGWACWLLLLDHARCHGCLRQHYRPLFFPAPEYPDPSATDIHSDPCYEYGTETEMLADEPD